MNDHDEALMDIAFPKGQSKKGILHWTGAEIEPLTQEEAKQMLARQPRLTSPRTKALKELIGALQPPSNGKFDGFKSIAFSSKEEAENARGLIEYAAKALGWVTTRSANKKGNERKTQYQTSVIHANKWHYAAIVRLS